MSNGNGHRWSKFWWGDWQNDAALRMCGLAAQGLWMRLLCVMHDAEPVGHLTVNGRIPTTRQLAAIAGAIEKEVVLYLHELEENGVFSRLPDGTIYCRRMVRDAVASEEGREHIAKRWASRDPNTPPIRGATSKPNGEATGEPITRLKKQKKEAEEEPIPLTPFPDGTPASPGTPPAAALDFLNLRKNGRSPRELGTNPRANGTNPRANSAQHPWRSGALELIYNEGLAAEKAAKDAADFEKFRAVKGLRYGSE